MRTARGPRLPLLLAVLCACQTGVERGPDDPAAVRDLDGSTHRPLAPAPGRSSVLFFIVTDCPIANSLAPEIQSLIDEHADGPLDFYVVYVDPQASREALLDHARTYGYRAPILADAAQVLPRKLGVTHTPEAAVVAPGGELSYLGRINDLYGALGRRRPAPTRRDLSDHLEALVAGRPVVSTRTAAVGCLLPDPPPEGE